MLARWLVGAAAFRCVSLIPTVLIRAAVSKVHIFEESPLWRVSGGGITALPVLKRCFLI